MNKILIALILSFTGITAAAQVAFGIKAGANISDTRTKTANNLSARFGFQAGAFCNIEIDKKFMIRPELLYALKGYKTPAVQFTTGGTISFSYINMPLLVGYKPLDKLQILAGPELGYMLKASSHFGSIENDITQYRARFDVSAVLGGIYSFTDAIAADIRVCYGLAPKLKGQLVDMNGNIVNGKYGDNFNVSFQIGFNYTFKNKH